MTDKRPLVLVDGSSYLFRAYHAIPPLLNSDGMPTGAIYGVINMLRRLLRAEKTTKVAVVFDAKGKTFRHDLYDDYKANRPPTPEDLSVQIEPLHAIVRAMGLPLLAIPGVEADDVIGTLCHQAAELGEEVILSTGDKDLAQLVTKQITWSNDMSGQRLDPAGVVEKFGVGPDKIIDYLALIGDKVDNVPGIPKVGPKTAVKWLEAYGSLEGVIASADAVKGKVGESLREHLDQLPLSKELVTIKKDIPLPLEIADLVKGTPDEAALLHWFQKLEFKTWLKEMGDVPETKQAAPKTSYQLITQQKDLNHLSQQLARAQKFSIAVVSEADSECVGLGLSLQPAQAYYLPLRHEEGEQLAEDVVWEALKPAFEDHAIEKLGYNLKLQGKCLAKHGIKLAGKLTDTMLLSYIKQSARLKHVPEAMAEFYLKKVLPALEELQGKGKNKQALGALTIDALLPYAAAHADIPWQLSQHIWHQLTDEEKRLYSTLEAPVLEILMNMELLGVRLDIAALNQQSAELAQACHALEETCREIAGESFNLGSPKQLQYILYEKLGLPVLKKTPTGQLSTSEDVLQELAHEYELPQHILRYRSLAKLKNTYTDKLPELVDPGTQRVHTTYQQAVVATGRLSSIDPNLQNIPIRNEEGRRVRKAFIPEDGYQILAADYSQIELRIMAHLSGDENLCQAFKNGEDIHRFTASEVFQTPLEEVDREQRRKAKAINFGLIYGMSAFGLAKQLEVDRSEAQAYMDHYFERYPGVEAYMQRTREQAKEQGFVETLWGRRLYLPDIQSKNMMLRRAAERAAINAPMQGSAADIIKLAMIAADKLCQASEGQLKLIMQVHDELVFEASTTYGEDAMYQLSHQMAMVGGERLNVPLVVEYGVGEHWEAAH